MSRIMAGEPVDQIFDHGDDRTGLIVTSAERLGQQPLPRAGPDLSTRQSSFASRAFLVSRTIQATPRRSSEEGQREETGDTSDWIGCHCDTPAVAEGPPQCSRADISTFVCGHRGQRPGRPCAASTAHAEASEVSTTAVRTHPPTPARLTSGCEVRPTRRRDRENVADQRHRDAATPSPPPPTPASAHPSRTPEAVPPRRRLRPAADRDRGPAEHQVFVVGGDKTIETSPVTLIGYRLSQFDIGVRSGQFPTALRGTWTSGPRPRARSSARHSITTTHLSSLSPPGAKRSARRHQHALAGPQHRACTAGSWQSGSAEVERAGQPPRPAREQDTQSSNSCRPTRWRRAGPQHPRRSLSSGPLFRHRNRRWRFAGRRTRLSPCLQTPHDAPHPIVWLDSGQVSR